MGNYCISGVESEFTLSRQDHIESTLRDNISYKMTINSMEMKKAANATSISSSQQCLQLGRTRTNDNIMMCISRYPSVISGSIDKLHGDLPPHSMKKRKMNNKSELVLLSLDFLNKSRNSVLASLLQRRVTAQQRSNYALNICYDQDGSTYSGEFKSGQKNGFGEIVYLDGSHYIGEWKQDLRNGKGIFFFKNGDIYIGDFQLDSATVGGKTSIPTASFCSLGWFLTSLRSDLEL